MHPQYFNSSAFGNLTNYFDFLTGFDDKFHGFLGVKPILTENFGWTDLTTKEEWIAAVTQHFKPQLHVSHTECDTTNIPSTPPYVTALCIPRINGALDYHWAVYNGMYWLEQADDGGPINIWASIDGLLDDVYNRRNAEGKLYIRDSHFFFSKTVA